MNALTLQWHDAGQDKTQNIYERQPSKNPGTVRIGRDPLRCDIVVTNPTVSGLHVEIFFHSQQQNFYIRNLREPNPPLVDGNQLFQGEVPLREGSVIYLGQMLFKVIAVTTNSFPATVLTPPQPNTPPQRSPTPKTPQKTPLYSPPQPQPGYQQQIPKTPLYRQPQVQPGEHHHEHKSPVYGLECPKCHKVSPAENIQVGCPWCGTSLAAAVSVLVTPKNYGV
jgi:ssDNA-binding Zn-finger/Zn-ribbon topoisomerase 1